MARARTLTKLPLTRWAQLMGISPLHFEGVYVDDPTVCEQTWFQYAWQDVDRVSREDVAIAIAKAEDKLERHLGYRLLPSWEVDEWSETTRAFRTELVNLPNLDVRGFAQTAKSRWGYIVSGGIRAKTLIDADAAIVYSDPDADGYDELATVTAAVAAGTLPCEIRAYYPDHSGADEWEIRPITVSVVGAVATITFRRELAVIEALLEALVLPAGDSHHRGADGTDDDDFLEEVDVYRVYNDPQTQASLLWEPPRTWCTVCVSDACEHCAYTTQTACLAIRGDPRQGILGFHPAEWDAVNGVFDQADLSVGRQPDLARLYYYAGWENKALACPRIQMDPYWERIVAVFAAGMLERPICECNNVSAYIERWRQDLAVPNETNLYSRLTEKQIGNPFGTTRGALYAWSEISQSEMPIGKAARV